MRFIVVLTGLLAFAAPASAFDPANMTPEERTAFETEVHNYLLAHPEILIEMSSALEAKQAAEQAKGDTAIIAAKIKNNCGCRRRVPNHFTTNAAPADMRNMVLS